MNEAKSVVWEVRSGKKLMGVYRSERMVKGLILWLKDQEPPQVFKEHDYKVKAVKLPCRKMCRQMRKLLGAD